VSEKLVDIREKLASHIGARVRYRQSKLDTGSQKEGERQKSTRV